MNDLVEVVGIGLRFWAAFPIRRPVSRRYEIAEGLHLPGHGSSRSLSSQGVYCQQGFSEKALVIFAYKPWMASLRYHPWPQTGNLQ